ncbi:MAG: DNA polymerase IV [Candidatus Vogelbacteria bacterium]|nr:DNA polymerase IV [Candidatus Vogelbacteria bacterium]
MITSGFKSMGWGHGNPRAILHIDGDGFFAACEVALNPKLRGKPVVTGAERGIASAMTYEAKARGVKRGMPLHEIRRVCPEAIILPANYETYAIFSTRMNSIVRRYTEAVEEYGIDECFAEITGLRRPLKMTYEEIGRTIKRELQNELGITFSLGLAPNKVLAKLGSKWQKPDGFTYIRAQGLSLGNPKVSPCAPLNPSQNDDCLLSGYIRRQSSVHSVHSDNSPEDCLLETSKRQSSNETTLGYYLAHTPCEKVWGIGPQTAALLAERGVMTALDFAHKDETWVATHLTKPHIEIWRELRGEFVLPLETGKKQHYDSIQKTKTFTPPSNDQNFLLSELSKNCENACAKARHYKLFAKKISFFLKTQQFRYRGIEITLPSYTSLPNELMRLIRAEFPKVYRTNEIYRASGVTLYGLTDTPPAQQDLFGASITQAKASKVFERVDALAERYGNHTVTLGSSLSALRPNLDVGRPGSVPRPVRMRFGAGGRPTSKVVAFQTKNPASYHLVIPLMGNVY